ncbi:ANTAR domain-containing protein [Kineococcus rubinsiae]|uniref:ANTAR domain-containing protein n=1 Tax=Kineococcus rubinsiae TaxID=2609562 RepID=UPI001AD940F0|nr:GAF and ANTAR domain-containing protein [Kineococcus rubinsiae]
MPATSPEGELGTHAAVHFSALRDLARILLGERSLTAVLHEVARLARVTIPGVDEVSITLESDATRISAFSGSLAVALDEWQYEAGFGPCVGAATSGVPIRSDDTACDDLYPSFAALARRQGVTSLLAMPLPMPSRFSGAIGLYRLRRDEPVSREAEAVAASFAVYAGVAVANAALFAQREQYVNRLVATMESRSVIDQAKGVVMSAVRCDADAAFQVLVLESNKSNRKVRDLAVDIVSSAERGDSLNLS